MRLRPWYRHDLNVQFKFRQSFYRANSETVRHKSTSGVINFRVASAVRPSGPRLGERIAPRSKFNKSVSQTPLRSLVPRASRLSGKAGRRFPSGGFALALLKGDAAGGGTAVVYGKCLVWCVCTKGLFSGLGIEDDFWCVCVHLIFMWSL